MPAGGNGGVAGIEADAATTGGAGGASSAGAAGMIADGAATDAHPTGDASGFFAKEGCANNNYAICIDFESGIDPAVWTSGTASSIVTGEVAHGLHSYRLYPMGGALLKTTKMGTIKDQVWGRFYVHFKPGAPGGHGAIVGIYDQSMNWYEIGWQFDAIMGVWHAANAQERPTRSLPFIVDQWYCIEYFFDGTKTNMPQWWIDGQEAQYYMEANTTLIPKVVTQFTNLFIGFQPYAGLGLQMPDGKGPIDTRVLTDMWIDDIAFDIKRIGCIQ